MDFPTLLLGVALLSGLYIAWNVGANDVANVIGTAIGTHALSVRRAIVVAACFELAGALLCGGPVTETFAERLVHLPPTSDVAVALAMTVALVVAAIFLYVATRAGWPVATTPAMLGAILGVGLAAGGLEAVQTSAVLAVIGAWVAAPFASGVIAFVLFRLLQRQVLDRERPLAAIQRLGPLLIGPIAAVLVVVVTGSTVLAALLDVRFERDHRAMLAAGVGLVATIASVPFLRAIRDRDDGERRRGRMPGVERAFLGMQGLTACALAFAHGSNDVAHAVGPMAAVASALRFGANAQLTVTTNVVLVGGAGIVLGLFTQGHRAMSAMSEQVTELTPSRGFVAELAAMVVVMYASGAGLPVSATHTLIGAVVGVAFSRSIGALNMQVVRTIALSWAITLPATLAASAVLLALVRLVAG